MAFQLLATGIISISMSKRSSSPTSRSDARCNEKGLQRHVYLYYTTSLPPANPGHLHKNACALALPTAGYWHHLCQYIKAIIFSYHARRSDVRCNEKIFIEACVARNIYIYIYIYIYTQNLNYYTTSLPPANLCHLHRNECA